MTEAKAGTLANTKKLVVDSVGARIQELTKNQQLQLPPDYSASNALQAAWLNLQETKNKDKQPVLEACSRNSIVNAVFSMIVQGLDVGKRQGYFIAYGRALTFQRSYFGTLAVAKRMADVKDAYAQVIYEGDTFEYEIRDGRKTVTKHTQKLEDVDPGKIKGAYAVVTFNDADRPDTVEVMTFPQIQQAWSKGQGKNMAREEFPDQMAVRTVLNRALKLHINSSDDNHLALTEFNREPGEAVEASAEAEAAEHANSEVIDVEPPKSEGAAGKTPAAPEGTQQQQPSLDPGF